MLEPRILLTSLARALILAGVSLSVVAALPSCSGNEPRRSSDDEDEDEDTTTTTSTSTGGAMVCTPNQTEACYSGPNGTEGVSTCKGGMHTCLPNGTGFGPCEGEVLPQVETCDTPEDDNCDGLTECHGIFVFHHHFGGDGNADVKGIDVDDEGNIVVAGVAAGSLDFGPDSTPVSASGFVAKFDPFGKLLWNKGTPASASDVAIDAEGNVIVAEANCELHKLDSTGKLVWNRPKDPDCSAEGMQIDTDQAGNIVLFGEFGAAAGAEIDFGPGPLASKGNTDVFIAKLAPDGNAIFAKSFGDGQKQTAVALSVDSLGNINVVGDLEGTVTFGGTPLDGLPGQTAYAAKFGSTGEHVWSKRFIGHSFGAGFGVTSDPQGNTYAAVLFGQELKFDNFSTSVDPDPRNVALVRMNAQGTHVYTETITGECGSQASLAIGPFGGLNAAGNFSNGVSFLTLAHSLDASPSGLYIGGVDSGGGFIYARALPVTDPEAYILIASSPSGDILAAAGAFVGDLDFGNEKVTSAGTGKLRDIFVARITP